MTREEATEELKILKENYWDDDGYGHETKQYDDTMLALDMAIKALEQEPIIDKVRVEVEKLDYLSIEDGMIGILTNRTYYRFLTSTRQKVRKQKVRKYV